MSIDRSQGWDAIADQFMAVRSAMGATRVRDWARDALPPGAAILDLGCGSGMPMAETLIDAGFELFGIDASPRMIEAFRARFPDRPSACEAAQDSTFFHRPFDAVIAIGLLFLLPPEDQRALVNRVAGALHPGGRFLFTAPRQACDWQDRLTGRRSVSLGEHVYEEMLAAAGLSLLDRFTDEGGNLYHDAARPGL
ncbi:conserved hypothetical protein [Sphingobium sp. SYK-6]|uniref:class I SAM-dependent methyltransferase n=1 Tax=Sphingobium sp. (strain NBRC 103272 / SYK-6) TaxID=627192 RepID=UPI0002277739|nr:class I SAM-dependent methyltransferase [Sphingobium sp. SYK-6]BAK67907.1 conserved hypothetical protein [Sphingobium sp. SYK-6]